MMPATAGAVVVSNELTTSSLETSTTDVIHRTLLALFAVTSAACAAAPAATVVPSPAPVAVTATMTAAMTATTRMGLASDDRVRLAEAFRLGAVLGDRLWPGWTSAPFAVLLVTAERELLLRHPRPSADFMRMGYDSLLGTEVFARARVLAPNVLATFPAVGGVPTIVVGLPAATGKSSTAWVLTVLHEHFHQLQMSRPGYYAGVAALGLSRGDQTGMWMLDFPFPYDSAAVRARFGDLTRALDGALEATAADARDTRAARWRAVVDARGELRAAITPDDEKYLAFQMWQEGVARYTELRVARWAAGEFAPSAAFRALPDFTSFASAADAIDAGIRRELRASDLARSRRVVFYPVGAATALLLDRVAPSWRTRYLEHPYSLDALAP